MLRKIILFSNNSPAPLKDRNHLKKSLETRSIKMPGQNPKLATLRRAIGLATALAIASQSVGCMLLDPYPKSAQPTTPLTYTSAITMAETQQSDYRNFVENNELSASWLGAGLILLSGAAIGLGTAGASATAATGIGVGGATGAAVGVWTQDKPRVDAYRTAVGQIQCVIDDANATQLPDPSDSNRIEGIQSKISALGDTRETLAGDANVLSIETCPRVSEAAQVSAALADARLTKATANATEDRANTILAAAQALPDNIVGAVHAIDAQKFAGASAGAPDLNDLPKVNYPRTKS